MLYNVCEIERCDHDMEILVCFYRNWYNQSSRQVSAWRSVLVRPVYYIGIYRRENVRYGQMSLMILQIFTLKTRSQYTQREQDEDGQNINMITYKTWYWSIRDENRTEYFICIFCIAYTATFTLLAKVTFSIKTTHVANILRQSLNIYVHTYYYMYRSTSNEGKSVN